MMKQCSKCKETKSVKLFRRRKSASDGLDFWCKECETEYKKTYYKVNRQKCIDKAYKWIEDNRQKHNCYCKKWQSNNKEKYDEVRRKWRKSHPEKWREYAKIYYSKRRSNSEYKLSNSMRVGIWRSIRDNKKGCNWEDLVGYTIDQLKYHIERQFNEDMSWDNYGEWHIDHIVPVSAFNFNKAKDIDFKKCWALKNLRPLWAHDNLSKRDKLEKPFQPSLAFG